jgi:hypothetical protein
MKSSFHSLIPFLPLFCSCQFRRLDSIQFLCSKAHISAGWRLETRLFCTIYAAEYFFITTLHGPRRKCSLCCWGDVFADPLPNNGRSIVVRFGSHGNVFTESLPSNESIRHIKQRKKHMSHSHLHPFRETYKTKFSFNLAPCHEGEALYVHIL